MISCANIGQGSDGFGPMQFAMVEERGKLSRKREPSSISALTVEFVRASLKWNHGISKFEIIRKNRGDPE